MSSGIIESIKKIALNAFEATSPVKLLFGKVISTDPVKIQVGDTLTLTIEFLVINGEVFKDDDVTLIRVQGGQKYVVLGTRTGYVENTVYTGGGEMLPDGTFGNVDGKWQFPYKGDYTITSQFGVARGSGTKHKGVDLVGKSNKHIYPVYVGKVITKRYDGDGYGNYVVIEHGNGYWSLYAHLKTVYVNVGQTVNADTILGVEGSTGRSTGSHLHLEIRKSNNSSSSAIDPISFLNGK